MKSLIQRKPPSCRRNNLKITDLPPEILRRIAAFITYDLFLDGPHNLYSALALSRTCTQFYQAVIEANNYKILLNQSAIIQQFCHFETLLSLFRPNVDHVHLEYDVDCAPHIRDTPLYNNFKLGETMLFGVLVAKSLRTATIPDKLEYLYAIRHAKSLKNLYIRLNREPSPEIGHTITSLQLNHLSVSNEEYFKYSDGGYPCLINVFRFNGGTPMFRHKCVSITSIGFSCRCADTEHYSLTTLLEAFPNLQDAHISASMSPAVAPFFKHLCRINLETSDNIGEICESLGSSVVAVKTDSLLSRSDFHRLSQSRELVELKCRVSNDSEAALHSIIKSSRKLKSLQIRWGHAPKTFFSGTTLYGRICSIRSRTISRLVRAACLRHFEVGSVRASCKELVEVFKIMGERAEHITLNHILVHGETTFRALILLMDTAAVHNRNLKQLQLTLIPSPQHLGFEEDRGPTRGYRLYESYARLCRLVPWLKAGDLKESLDDMVNYAYEITDVMGRF